MKRYFFIWFTLLVFLFSCNQQSDKPTITSFKAGPNSISQGDSSILTWIVTNADSLTLTPGDVDVSGKNSHVVTPDVTTTYTLTAKNGVGSSEAKTTVTVDVEALEPVVDPDVIPSEPSVPDKDGKPQSVAASQDENGVQSEFIVGQVLVKPEDETDLSTFLERYEGTVLSDNTIPVPPASLGIILSDEERQANEYLVQINLAKVDPADFPADAAAVGMGGLLLFSSQDGLLTLAAATDALADGYSVSPNYVDKPAQTFPNVLFQTAERPDGAGGFTDAFSAAGDYSRFRAGGSQSNVTLAWQFVAAHGVQRRVRLAIIDSGFWLNPDGTPRGADSDLPPNPIQYDFVAGDYLADGPNPRPCQTTNPCFWHGTGSAGTAAGVMNNNLGAVGTGGQVADVMLFKKGPQHAQRHWAVRTALAWGADVISMSFGSDCDSVACRRFDRENTPFSDAFEGGSRTVFVASAGNNAHSVGEPFYTHPCIEDHVICVGALDDDKKTHISYSNFGPGVDIYAPTNIPVMSYPSSVDSAGKPLPLSAAFGPEAPRSHGGTSASAPFIAGVAAMMKAINPDLNTEDVNRILRDTAHNGAAPVTHFVDAYTAVRAAASGIDGVKDRYETNDVNPTPLSGFGPWNEANLSLHNAADRDYFTFTAPGGSALTLNLQYPEGLGALPLIKLESQGACGGASLLSEAPSGNGRGRSLSYRAPGGSYLLGLGGGQVNAYNLGISFSAPTLATDSYEANDTPATATWLHGFRPVKIGEFVTEYLAIDPRFNINASLHTSADVDYYIIQAAKPNLSEIVHMNAFPNLRLYGNESSVTLEVFTLNPDNTPGTLVSKQSSGVCTQQGLSVNLTADASYLVKVSGAPGGYQLANGASGEKRRLPVLVRDRIYEILHPGEPVERVIRFPELYVFPGDQAYSELNLKGQGHLQLFDFGGNLLLEGESSEQGFDETLRLGDLARDALYSLQLSPKEPQLEGTPITLSWGEVSPSRQSDNIILNPDAEEGPANDGGGEVEFVQDWSISEDGLNWPTVVYYNGILGLPDQDSPGPEERGEKFFAGGPDNIFSGIKQTIELPEDWYDAIDNGSVKFNLAAFLGGKLSKADKVTLTLLFRDTAFDEAGQVSVGPVNPREREVKTGLFPVGVNDYLPTKTRSIEVDMRFTRLEGDYNDAYADGLELTLLDYTP